MIGHISYWRQFGAICVDNTNKFVIPKLCSFFIDSKGTFRCCFKTMFV